MLFDVVDFYTDLEFLSSIYHCLVDMPTDVFYEFKLVSGKCASSSFLQSYIEPRQAKICVEVDGGGSVAGIVE
jgi:hypothetical protein